MSSWDYAFTKLMRWECHPGPIKPIGDGYVDNPNDHGGRTVYGISTKEILRHKTKPEDLGITDFSAEQMVQVTLEAAKKWHKVNYWDKHPYVDIKSDIIATKIYLLSVNNNPTNSWKFAQQAANICGSKLVVDSNPGPLTIAAINSRDQVRYIYTLIDLQVQFYQGIVDAHPDQAVFLKGWLARARDI